MASPAMICIFFIATGLTQCPYFKCSTPNNCQPHGEIYDWTANDSCTIPICAEKGKLALDRIDNSPAGHLTKEIALRNEKAILNRLEKDQEQEGLVDGKNRCPDCNLKCPTNTNLTGLNALDICLVVVSSLLGIGNIIQVVFVILKKCLGIKLGFKIKKTKKIVEIAPKEQKIEEV